jgi:hypothetical protein
MFIRTAIWILPLLVVAQGSSRAQEGPPPPPKNWWKSLKAGNTATYKMEFGPSSLTMVIAVTGVEGTKISYSSQTLLDGKELRLEKNVFDAGKKPHGHTFSDFGAEGAKIGKGETKFIPVGKTRFRCKRYSIETQDFKTKLWHSEQMPPIFNAGILEAEKVQGGVLMTRMTLTKYEGPLLEQE